MSWAQLSKTDFLGTSPFQNMCCRDVRKFLPGLEFSESGTTEKVFLAKIPSANLELTLYADSVLLSSPTDQLILHSAGFDQPEDLVARLIAELSNAI